MQSRYPVMWNGENAGEVKVRKEGLYYAFDCRAELPEGSRCRLYVSSGKESRDLGICIPEGQGFALRTRIAAKYFPEGEYRFSLNQPVQGEFIPISCDREFPALDRLETGKLVICDGKAGIVFPDMAE